MSPAPTFLAPARKEAAQPRHEVALYGPRAGAIAPTGAPTRPRVYSANDVPAFPHASTHCGDVAPTSTSTSTTGEHSRVNAFAACARASSRFAGPIHEAFASDLAVRARVLHPFVITAPSPLATNQRLTRPSRALTGLSGELARSAVFSTVFSPASDAKVQSFRGPLRSPRRVFVARRAAGERALSPRTPR